MNRISADVALSLENRITELEGTLKSFNPTPAQHNKKNIMKSNLVTW